MDLPSHNVQLLVRNIQGLIASVIRGPTRMVDVCYTLAGWRTVRTTRRELASMLFMMLSVQPLEGSVAENETYFQLTFVKGGDVVLISGMRAVFMVCYGHYFDYSS